MKKILSVISVCMLLTTTVYGQLVNIENMRKGNKEGFQGGISLSLDLKENTKRIFQTKNTVDFQYKKREHTVLLINNLSFLQVNTEDALVNTGMQHLRYNYTFAGGKSPITLEVFAQHQYNSVKMIKTRFISGIGPRIRLLGTDTTNFYMFLSPLVMYEYESLKDEDDDLIADPEEIDSRMKADLIFSASYQVNSVFSINNVTYYQPEFTDFSDYRISSDSSLKFKVSDKLAFAVVFNFDYDSKPPINQTDNTELLPKLFYNLSNRISYSF